jgi:predicted nucleic acid-binding protein
VRFWCLSLSSVPTYGELYSEHSCLVKMPPWARLEEAGVGVDLPDLGIASVAIAENKTLASNDGVFEHVTSVYGLRFERWEP